jgi:hypothetical protein
VVASRAAGHRDTSQPRTPARIRKKGNLIMFDRLAAHRPPPITDLSPRTRRAAIGTAAVIPALLIGVLASTGSGTPHDSASSPARIRWPPQDVPAADYTTLRAEFAGSRYPDLRTAGTAYVDLAVQLLTARGTDGYQTVWFYQRLSAACAKHQH